MTVSSCPKCEEKVRIPAQASDEAVVSCPLCSEEFALADLLDSLPPELIVVKDAKREAAAETAEQVGFNLGPEPENATQGEFSFNETPAPQSSGKSYSPAARPKRRSPNMAVEGIKIALGGLAGLTIAQLILWWGFNRDPLDIGKKVGTYVPAIVPQEYRPQAEPDTDTTSNKTGKNKKANRQADNQPTITEFPQPGDNELTLGPDTEQGPDSELEPELSTDGIDPLPDANSSIDEPLVPEIELDPLAALDPETAKDTGPPSVQLKAFGIRNAPLYVHQDLVDAIEATLEVNDAWDTSDDLSDANKRDLYLSLTKIGDVVAVMNPDDPDSPGRTESLRKLLSSIVEVPAKRTLIQTIGRQWTNYDKRTTPGIAFVGVVKSLQADGRLFRTVIELKTGQESTVVTHLNPQEFCKPMSRVLVLGRIVDKPKDSIIGFSGSDERVVWGGMIIEMEAS